MTLQVFGVPGLPEIVPGSDLAAMILTAAAEAGTPLADGDVVVVTSKIVSKAEGRLVELADVEPSPFAVDWSRTWDKDPAVTELVLRESKRIVRQLGPILITETHHGFVCANSGIDQSSSGAHGRVVLLPVDPDASARTIRAGLRSGGIDAAVIEQRIGRLQPAKACDEPHSPGMMQAHYAPALPIRIDAMKPQKGVQEALLAFGTDVPRGFAHVLNLIPQGDVNEAAANLFAMLHELDRSDVEGIAVMPIPDQGLCLAINDRLRRAVQ